MSKLERDARHPLSVILNGKRASGYAEPRMLLIDFLRQEIGATGSHVGCEHGVCGACTVRVDGKAVRACLMYAVQVDGRRVDTVEGLAGVEGKLTALQRAFRRHHALQCGFCTPGMVMSAIDLVNNNPYPSESEIRSGLEGNLCRCTGYHNIVKSVQAAAVEMGG